MKSKIQLKYFSGAGASAEFDEWSKDNPEADIKDFQVRVITEGMNDGCLSIIIIYEVPSKILAFPEGVAQ